MRSLAVIAGVALALSSSPAGAGQEQERPTFRAELDLVPVAAVVRDRTGRPVSGLRPRDFVVLDGGVERPIVGFSEDASAAASLAVLVDESGSMREYGGSTQQVVANMLTALGLGGVSGDQVTLLGFDSSVHELQPFTPQLDLVRHALVKLDPYGATAVHDAIAATARRLLPVSGRRALVVVTDGRDTRSRLTLTEVSGIASSIDVPVYIVLMGRSDPPKSAGKEAAPSAPLGPLQDLARWTGGEAFAAAAPHAIELAAQRIVSDVRHQYLIAFESASEPGWRLLEIQTRQPGLVVRARSAYVAGRDGSRSVR
jgi:Ca-activated chloride channel family protein